MDEIDPNHRNEYDDSIDFDSEDEGSFLFTETRSEHLETSTEDCIHPHTEMVDGFLQIFAGDKQITFDEAHHTNPRILPSNGIEWDITETPNPALNDEWKTLARTDIASFAQQMQDAGVATKRIPNGVAFEITVPGGRTQWVYVTEMRSDIEGDAIIQVMTRCGDPSHIPLDNILRRNMIIPYGAFAIAQLEAKDCLVIVDTWLSEATQAIELRKAVFSIAKAGDELEAMLQSEDIF